MVDRRNVATGPVVSIALAAETMGVTYHFARRYMHRFLDLGILRPYARLSYQDYFIASEILAAA